MIYVLIGVVVTLILIFSFLRLTSGMDEFTEVDPDVERFVKNKTNEN